MKSVNAVLVSDDGHFIFLYINFNLELTFMIIKVSYFTR